MLTFHSFHPPAQFPTNYFSVAGAEQWFPEEFARAFEWNSGEEESCLSVHACEEDPEILE